MITADSDLVPNDDRGYRVAVIEAFRRRGIYPRDVRNLSIEGLRWPASRQEDSESFKQIAAGMGYVLDRSRYLKSRQESFKVMSEWRAALHNFITYHLKDVSTFERLTGLMLRPAPGIDLKALGFMLDNAGNPRYEVHSLHPAQRVGPDGNLLNQLIISITQQRAVPLNPAYPEAGTFAFRGGCTLILDQDSLSLTYKIAKPIYSDGDLRMLQQRQFINDSSSGSLRATYFSPLARGAGHEPFALLHREA
jgi:hypothetical protein